MTAPEAAAKWTIPGDLQRVAGLVVEAADFLADHGVSGRPLLAAQLLVEEVVSNIVRHNYRGDPSGEVRVTIAVDPAEIRLTVEDDGRPFDPQVDAPPADTESPLDERPVGGLGLHLVREFASRVDYARVGGMNRLTMVIGLEQPA